MERKRLRWWWIGVTAGISLILLSCGGGGGSGGGSSVDGFKTPASSQAVTLDRQSAETTFALIGFARTVGDMGGDVGGFFPFAQGDSVQDAGLIRTFVNRVAEQLPHGGYTAAGSESETFECQDGGKLSISIKYIDPPSNDPCEAGNVRGTFKFSNCQEGSEMIDGSLAFEFPGLLCNPTAIKFTFTNMVVTEEPGFSFQSRKLQLSLTALGDWVGSFPYDGGPRSWTLEMNGQAVGEMEGKSFAAAFEGYTEVFNYGSPSFLAIAGKITGPCLDGWATLSTTDSIEIDGIQECPVAGRLILSGSGDEVEVVFGAGGSVDIGDNHYSNCDDIDAVCPLI